MNWLLYDEGIVLKQVKEDLNTFSTNVPLLYPLKTLENQRFSDVFKGCRSGTLVENGLKTFKNIDLTSTPMAIIWPFKYYLPNIPQIS